MKKYLTVLVIVVVLCISTIAISVAEVNRLRAIETNYRVSINNLTRESQKLEEKNLLLILSKQDQHLVYNQMIMKKQQLKELLQ